jgi:sRNA-binding protein
VTNNAQTLAELMKNTDRKNKIVVAPSSLYAKYIWEPCIECMPVFEDLRDYSFDPMLVSEQQLALALACWMGSVSVFLVGYQLDSIKETPALKVFSKLYPHTKFAYIRKPNPQKIGVFKDCPNILIEETHIFQEMIKNVITA